MRPINEEALAQYRATAQARERERQQALAERTQRAWEVARQAADLLRHEFRVTKVVLLGSLARGQFSLWSDIDLAAWDIGRDDYFVAVAHLQDLSGEFKIDLIDAQRCRLSMRKAIDEEGVTL